MLCHRLDVLPEQVSNQLAEIEAPNGCIARGQGSRIVFPPALAELAALFGMADQGLDSGAAVRQSRAGGALALRERGGIEAGVLEANLLQPWQRLQLLPMGSAVIALVRPTRPQGAGPKELLVLGNHRPQGGGGLPAQ